MRHAVTPANRFFDVRADIALGLARYFGAAMQSWHHLQQAYDLKMAASE
jgi:plasmid maintenance system antidote protein VapI